MSNKLELKVVYQQKIPVGKKLAILFFGQSVSQSFAINVWMYDKWRGVKIGQWYMVFWQL